MAFFYIFKEKEIFMKREAQADIEKRYIERWSPRSFNENTMIPKADLMSLFEAARWSPSSYNSQPWRFIYSSREERSFNDFVNLLNDFNKKWASDASALVFIVAKKYNKKGDELTHSEFDTGSAWMALTMQARELGYVTHAMAGIEYDDAYKKLDIDKNKYKLICCVAIGKKDSPEKLSEELKDKEEKSSRLDIDDIIFQGKLNQ